MLSSGFYLGPTGAHLPGMSLWLPLWAQLSPWAAGFWQLQGCRNSHVGAGWLGAAPGFGGCEAAPAPSANLITVETTSGSSTRGWNWSCGQTAFGSSMARSVLPLCLLLSATLQGSLPNAPGLTARSLPLLWRLRQLEEQVGAGQPGGRSTAGPIPMASFTPLHCSFAGSRR